MTEDGVLSEDARRKGGCLMPKTNVKALSVGPHSVVGDAVFASDRRLERDAILVRIRTDIGQTLDFDALGAIAKAILRENLLWIEVHRIEVVLALEAGIPAGASDDVRQLALVSAVNNVRRALARAKGLN